MCMGACYWARIDKVFYATTAKDVKVCCTSSALYRRWRSCTADRLRIIFLHVHLEACLQQQQPALQHLQLLPTAQWQGLMINEHGTSR
jgi:tRNA(Arg) A34 adenosine deaminase TadA